MTWTGYDGGDVFQRLVSIAEAATFLIRFAMLVKLQDRASFIARPMAACDGPGRKSLVVICTIEWRCYGDTSGRLSFSADPCADSTSSTAGCAWTCGSGSGCADGVGGGGGCVCVSASFSTKFSMTPGRVDPVCALSQPYQQRRVTSNGGHVDTTRHVTMTTTHQPLIPLINN